MFTLPSVLPHDIAALKTLLVAQKNAHLAVVQAMHQEAQAIRCEAHDYVIRMLEQAVLARQRMFGASSEQPLHNLMRDILLDGALIHMDERVVQVLKEPNRAPTSNSYMWVQTGGPPDNPVVLYDYDASRSAKVPTRLLEGFEGYLMTDGYDGYNAIAGTVGIGVLSVWRAGRMCAGVLSRRYGCNPRANAAGPMRR